MREDPHLAERTLDPPHPPFSKMPVLGHPAICIPPTKERLVRGVARAAVREKLIEDWSWSYQEGSDVEQTIVYVVANEPRVRNRKRSWGARALLSISRQQQGMLRTLRLRIGALITHAVR